MLPFLITEATALVRTVLAATLLLLLACLAPTALHAGGSAQEPRLVALHGFERQEVVAQGFTLPQAMTIHVYARGGAQRKLVNRSLDNPFFAYGWILNATTREVVWQMDGTNTKRDWDYVVSDRYLPLPAGSYEAVFANQGFGQSVLFAQWTRNIDRRSLQTEASEHAHGFLAAFGVDDASLLRHWRDQVGNYGMEIYLPGATPEQLNTFPAPLRWKHQVVTLSADLDGGHWQQTFRLQRPVTLHIYAEGEGSGRRMVDYGWIINTRTRARVWEMSMDKSQYAGGARKNRRQVETLQLPAGDYEASFVTDGSHSPADWNAAPPCDPELYGLTLSIPAEGELAAFSQSKPLDWTVVAELVRVGNSQTRSTPFTLATAQSVRVYALAEGTSDEMADEVWIEDASGRRVWVMEYARTHHAGGAAKNRVADAVVSLPKGAYSLHVQTDDSHAYGDWNSDAPRDAEHYGITVYRAR